MTLQTIKVGSTSCWFFLSRVQELSADDRREAGRIPRTIECELTSDLVDSCVPGDMVTITGIVKATSSDEGICVYNVKFLMGFLDRQNIVSIL